MVASYLPDRTAMSLGGNTAARKSLITGAITAGANVGAAIGKNPPKRSPIVSGAMAGATIKPIVPSKPVPPPSVHYIGGQPQQPGGLSAFKGGFGTVGANLNVPAAGPKKASLTGVDSIGRTVGAPAPPPPTPFTGKGDIGRVAAKPKKPGAAARASAAAKAEPVNPGAPLQPGVPGAPNPAPGAPPTDVAADMVARAQSGQDIHGSAGTSAVNYAKILGKQVGPVADDLARLRKQVEDSLADNTWTPAERVEIARNYREFLTRYYMGDPAVQQLNNYSVVSEYRRKFKEFKEKHAGDRTLSDVGKGGFFDLFEGPLESNTSDYYGPDFLLAQDERGFYFLTDTNEAWIAINSRLRDNPEDAADMITRLANWGAYGGAQEKYSKNNVVFDKHGVPIKARWTKDDEAALKQFISEVSVQQAGGDMEPWDDILDRVSAQNQQLGAAPGYGETDGGGGGGGYRRRGGGGYGGGGGGGGGVSYTDADQLKQLINGIARARLGYVLPDDQIAAFVADYHAKEAAYVNARIAGQDGQQLDPESQAAAWIEAHFRDPMAAQQANSYISTLANFLLSGSFGSST